MLACRWGKGFMTRKPTFCMPARIWKAPDGAGISDSHGIFSVRLDRKGRPMKYNSILNISLQQIQIFLKCIQYGNYSRVAEEYHFTPSMISKTIRAMEELLGLQLFVRDYHSLTPTPAARELAEGWKEVCNIVLDSISRACDVQEKLSSKIRIGLLETTQFCADYIMLKLEEQLEKNLLEGIQWERRDMHSLPDALEEGIFDMVITWSGEKPYFRNKDTAWKTIFRSPDAVFIAREHPLFEKEIHSFADFRPYPFITLSPTVYPHYYEFLQNICRKYGFSPLLSTICGSTESARYNLNLGKGAYVASSLICCDWENEDVRKVELEGEGNSDLLVVWKSQHLTQRMRQIIDIITH